MASSSLLPLITYYYNLLNNTVNITTCLCWSLVVVVLSCIRPIFLLQPFSLMVIQDSILSLFSRLLSSLVTLYTSSCYPGCSTRSFFPRSISLRSPPVPLSPRSVYLFFSVSPPLSLALSSPFSPPFSLLPLLL
jgi:hypothetical protein